MPERIREVEMVEMARPGDEKSVSDFDYNERFYYQKTPEMISTSNVWMNKDLTACKTRTHAMPDTKLDIADRSVTRQKSRRCSLWRLWLKFSSILYLMLITLLILWALHQHKVSQEKDSEATADQTSGYASALTSDIEKHGQRHSSKALLQYNLNQPMRDPEQIQWKNYSASYINGSDITYKKGRYYVSSSGYYEVQCRLQFDTYSGKVPTNDVHVVFSIIRSTGPESNRNLMSERATLRPRERRGIQLGPTVFHLDRGDSVYVSVMQHQYVYPTLDNYFAMRKIE